MNYQRFFGLEVTLFRILLQLTLTVAFRFEDVFNGRNVMDNFEGIMAGCIVAEIVMRLIYHLFLKE